MLREIGAVRQDGRQVRRRWLQDDDIDLFLWQSPDGRVIAMQLCYDRRHHERAVTWDERTGFAHHAVDAGERSPKHGMSPLLRMSGEVPYFELYHRFLHGSGDVESTLRARVLELLAQYRVLLFGRPRRPRRRRRSPRARDHIEGSER